SPFAGSSSSRPPATPSRLRRRARPRPRASWARSRSGTEMRARIAWFLLASLASSSACDRLTPPPAHEQQPQTKTAAPKSTVATAPSPADAGKQTAAPSPGELPVSGDRFPAPARLVAIGDLHGDIAATRKALRLAGADLLLQGVEDGADLLLTQLWSL